MNKFVPFDKYMEYCLYDRKRGYYMKEERVFGKEGDFYTPQTASSFFGKVIGKFIKKKGFKRVYEFGAGWGDLASDILSFNTEIQEYIIFEISEKMRKKIRGKLKNFENKVKIYTFIDEIHEIHGFTIMVEFIDSFPVKRFLKKENVVYEVWVDVVERKEILKKANYEFLKVYEFLPNGYYFEFPLSFLKWFKNFSKKFRKGEIFVVDYGLEKQDLIYYPQGTVRGFKKHRVIENILEFSPGEIDITYTPDFSLLKEIFEKEGFNLKKVCSLSKFLIEEGIIEIFEREISETNSLSFKIKKQSELKTLITPEMMGEKYMVLIVEK